MDDLEVCSVQGPRLPRNDPIHPLIGQRVRVTGGQFKGYDALVKNVASEFVLIEIEGFLVSGGGLRQVKWKDVGAMYVLFP